MRVSLGATLCSPTVTLTTSSQNVWYAIGIESGTKHIHGHCAMTHMNIRLCMCATAAKLGLEGSKTLPLPLLLAQLILPTLLRCATVAERC